MALRLVVFHVVVVRAAKLTGVGDAVRMLGAAEGEGGAGTRRRDIRDDEGCWLFADACGLLPLRRPPVYGDKYRDAFRHKTRNGQHHPRNQQTH
jgi:hypothetical protein